jgi:serine/threonine-protein kinase
MSVSESGQFELLDRIIEEFGERFRRGERPSLQEYLDRYPELGDDLRELFPAMVEMAQVEGDRRAIVVADRTPPPLRTLGDFRILREVGRGGMGVVYEAEQVSLGRRVALKVLTVGPADNPRRRLRFEREARAAGQLHHTNIVPIFGVGQHNATPYYVMQFIQGLGLDSVLIELRRLQLGVSTPAAGEEAPERDATAAEVAHSLVAGAYLSRPDSAAPPCLDATADVSEAPRPAPPSSEFPAGSSSVVLPGKSRSGARRPPTYAQSVAHIGVQVASALDHAHKQGVLHRDIKPSNLLLDGQGTVWVTDFGLAKAQGSENLTQTGDIMGTLRYMPPEAFDGRADARGDLYSLGLTLYELLASRPAFDETDRPRLIKQVTEGEPPRLDRLRPDLPRDLVTVVHKAIERDPGHRYPTAEELRADLQRFLDDEPIRARRLSLWEHGSRWCRRNPAVAMLTAASLLLLVATTAASLYAAAMSRRLAREEAAVADQERAKRATADAGRQREADLRADAEDNFAKARSAVDDYFTRVSESRLLLVSGLQPLRRELLESALAFYQDFLKKRGDDPELRTELAAALTRVGKIQAELGARSEARQAVERAVSLLEEECRTNPERAPALREPLADALYQLGGVDESDRPAAALDALGRAAQVCEALIADRPDSVPHKAKLGDVHDRQGKASLNLGRLDESFAYYRQGLNVRQELVLAHPDDADLVTRLGQSFNSLADHAERRGQPEAAVVMSRRAVELVRNGFERAPTNADYADKLAACHANLATELRQLGRNAEALAEYQKAVTHLATYCRTNPAVRRTQDRLIEMLRLLSRFPPDLLQAITLRKLFRVARDAFVEIPRSAPDDHLNCARARAWYGWSLSQWRAPSADEEQQQRAEYAEALNALRAALAAGVVDTAALRRDRNLVALRALPEFAALLDTAGKVPPVARGPRSPANEGALRQRLILDLAATHLALGQARVADGSLTEAEASFDQARALADELVREEPGNPTVRSDRARTEFSIGVSYCHAGRLAEGVACCDRGLAVLEELRRQFPNDANLTRSLAAQELALGHAYGRAGLWTEAARYLARALGRSTDFHSQDYYSTAVMLRMAGDEAGLRRHVSEAMARFANDPEPVNQANLLRILLVGNGDPAAIRAAEERCLADRLKLPWVTGYLVAAADRLGRSPDALRWAAGVHVAEPQLAHFLPTLALAEFRAEHEATARELLRRADERYKAVVRGQAEQTGEPVLPGFAEDMAWLILTRREAHRLIDRTDADEALWLVHVGQMQERLNHAEQAEAAFAAACAARPNDADVRLFRARVHGRLGRHDQEEADLAEALKLPSGDPRLWIEEGRSLAERGNHAGAEAAFTRAASLLPDNLNPFLEAGWWVAGPYPGQLEDAYPPENDPSPSRPAAGVGQAAPVPWRHATAEPNGAIYLGKVFGFAAPLSGYALNYVYAPRKREATLLVAGMDRVRLWVNGERVLQAPRWNDCSSSGPEGYYRVQVVLRPGRNTLLLKVTNQDPGLHRFRLRLADGPLDRGILLAEKGQWPEAAAELARAQDPLRADDPAFTVAYSRVLLAAGDVARYEQHQAQVWERFGRTTDPMLAAAVAAIGTLDAKRHVDPKRLAALADMAIKARPGLMADRLSRALAAYRAEEYEDAVKRLHALGERNPAAIPVLAMAYYRLGKKDEAKTWLAKGDAIPAAMPGATKDGSAQGGRWQEQAVFQILMREARALMVPKGK